MLSPDPNERRSLFSRLFPKSTSPDPAAPTTPTTGRWQQWLEVGLHVAEAVGSAMSASGYKPMKPNPDARIYEPAKGTTAASLPPKVDLRPHMSPVEDQGQTSSCTANAVAGSYEYWMKRFTEKDYDVSRLFIYYNARWRNNEQDKDAGSVIQLGMEGLQNFGACSEGTWPFAPKLVTVKPNGASYEEAAPMKVHDTRSVPVDLESWKKCLAEGNPIIFGCLLFNSFDECGNRGGVVQMPAPTELGRESHGAHAMCCVGYSDPEGVFIVRNSWGEKWGDKGYCYLPYNYLMNSKLNLGDSWVFIPSAGALPPPPTDAWVLNDKPITNDGQGVNFDPNAFEVRDYEKVNFDPFKSLVLDWNDEVTPDFQQFVEVVAEERFDELEHFELGEILSEAELKDIANESNAQDTEGASDRNPDASGAGDETTVDFKNAAVNDGTEGNESDESAAKAEFASNSDEADTTESGAENLGSEGSEGEVAEGEDADGEGSESDESEEPGTNVEDADAEATEDSDDAKSDDTEAADSEEVDEEESDSEDVNAEPEEEAEEEEAEEEPAEEEQAEEEQAGEDPAEEEPKEDDENKN